MKIGWCFGTFPCFDTIPKQT